MNSRRRTFLIVLLLIFALAAVTVTVVTVAVCVANSPRSLDFSRRYYYIYYKSQDDAYSASSISSTVQSYGGAGYVVKNGDKYYITVACYYDLQDAQSVCENLLRRGLDCGVLEVETGGFTLSSDSAKSNAERYAGNLNTLDELSLLCYETANFLDTGGYDQVKARGALDGVLSAFNGLLRENSANCFTDEINYLIAEWNDVTYGYIYSRDVRKLQIAITDCIVNIRLT